MCLVVDLRLEPGMAKVSRGQGWRCRELTVRLGCLRGGLWSLGSRGSRGGSGSAVESAVLFFQFLLCDAHEFARGSGGGEVGELAEFFVVDLQGGGLAASRTMEGIGARGRERDLWLRVEALPGEGEVFHLLGGERHVGGLLVGGWWAAGLVACC